MAVKTPKFEKVSYRALFRGGEGGASEVAAADKRLGSCVGAQTTDDTETEPEPEPPKPVDKVRRCSHE
jgi:hypothetical protein